MRILPQIILQKFNLKARGANHVLGELQSEVLELLWREPGLTVNEVETKLQQHREIAHTTVLTTLTRMHEKNYLTREKQGKAFVYAPRLTREEFEQSVAQEVLGALLGQFSAPALSAFVDLIGEDDANLNQLEEMIRAKRLEKNQ